ncbi:NADPH-dependent 2,4-dienoyl-CoA reductase, sulfur reductase [Desulfonispora thiosulfatigenes DSM 11270]|uniref:NADPH-dependent 2,4-dienoyl-CoA reductase, sulfur reductase n=1 Tax=Desulfonispora thiosulfatigenes DSM 11270 TaxID=656914 RepID=A0A1W1VSL6_DESTI|nr:FAD-dependent oxidoreductase [Desulfonispora thiosulfatigenes]SMB96220.1 NADPH-dependent 2,4-dienoyl-CoA reductase, sulfur reductase [Desulfonispora thiosulfatigenes DSM 11270]
MCEKKILIVGGVAGGATCAARLKRLSEKSHVVIFEKGEHISFANCGLPYHVGGIIRDQDNLLVSTPEEMEEKFALDIRVFNEVTSINPEKKEVEVKNLEDGSTYTEGYDYLVLSPGAEPIIPPIEGIANENVFTVRNIPDTERILDYIAKNNPKKAAVIGGGFIGIEMMENLAHIGIEVSVVDMAPQVMTFLDTDMVGQVQSEIKKHKVNLVLGDGLNKITDTGIELSSGKEIEADMIILAIGVRPDIKLAKDAGLLIGNTGAIKVDDYLQTSDPFIYAVGDAIEIKHFVDGSEAKIPLAGPANKQGRIAADNIMGRKVTYNGTQGTAIAKVFDLQVGATGLNERQLTNKGIEHKSVTIHPFSHAKYYPGASQMTLKVIFNDEGKILGAQAVGKDMVDKRIDVLATAMRFGKTVIDLQDLELVYAPPFGSAKDPVNMIGYSAQNLMEGRMSPIYIDELDDINKDDSFILDVREIYELDLGKMENATHIPLSELRESLDEIPKDKEIVVFCQIGIRGYIAEQVLRSNGYEKVKNLIGGYRSVVLNK